MAFGKENQMNQQLTMVYWKGEKFWLGKLLEYPEIMTQGESLEELEEKHKQELHENDLQHAADIAKIREELGSETDSSQSKEDKDIGNGTTLAIIIKEKETEIEELKKEAERDAKRAAQMLEEEKEAHEETRNRLESTIAEKLVAKSKRG